MGEQEVSNEKLAELLPDILAAFMSGDVDVRIVVCFEVGPTGCFPAADLEDADSEAVDQEGDCGSYGRAV